MYVLQWCHLVPIMDGGRFTAVARKRKGRIKYKCVPEGGAR